MLFLLLNHEIDLADKIYEIGIRMLFIIDDETYNNNVRVYYNILIF